MGVKILGSVMVWFLAIVGFWTIGLHSHPDGEIGLPQDVQFVPEAEALLQEGNVEGAYLKYREALETEENFPVRLAMAIPAAGTALAAGEFSALLDEVLEDDNFGEEWERRVMQGAFFAFAGDLTRARESLTDAAEDSPHRLLLLRQAAYWAEEMGQPDAAIEAWREVFAAYPEEENHAHLVEALLHGEEKERLFSHIEERSELWADEALFWARFFADFQDRGWLDDFAGLVERSWEEAEGAKPRFALGELRLFQRREVEAAERFWEVFRFSEEADASGAEYFNRLNAAFHNRFAARHRIGEALGRYGPASARQYAFLGMRDRLVPQTTGQARDGALLYLWELSDALEEGIGPFVEQLGMAFGEVELPPGARILAFAIVGAPARMLEEIDAFVASDETDSAAAEFSLRAINRHVRSVELFPSLREEKLRLTEAVEQKFDADRSLRERRGSLQMQRHIRGRLTDEAAPQLPEEVPEGEEEARHWYFAAVEAAIREERLERAEELWREWSRKSEGMVPANIPVFIGRAWLSQGRAGREPAADLLAEYLDRFRRSEKAGGAVAPGVISWEAQDYSGRRFPPRNSIISFEELDFLQELFYLLRQHEILDEVLESLHEAEAGKGEITASRDVLLRMTLMDWEGRRENAIETGKAFLGESGNEHAELRVLLAYLLGMEERFGDAQSVLADISQDAGEIFEEALKLRFAFAVRAHHEEGARRVGTVLEEQLRSPDDFLNLAQGYLETGLLTEARRVLADVGPVSQSRETQEAFRQTSLKLARALGEDEAAVGVARTILFTQLPDEWHELAADSRNVALAALQELNALDGYRDDVGRLLEAAPDAFHGLLLRAEIGWFQLENNESGNDRQTIVADLRQAASLRPEAVEFYWNLGYEFAAREWWDETAAIFLEVLERDAAVGLLDVSLLFRALGNSGELEKMLEYFEGWQMPEAWSLDEFYGLQPTAHIFESLGRRFLEQENQAAAREAWALGLRLNPVAFSEGIRLDFANDLLLPVEGELLIDLIRGYVVRPDADPQRYALQPFVTPLPRWLHAFGAPGEQSSPAQELIDLAREGRITGELDVASERWVEEYPEWISPAIFRVVVLKELEKAAWREEWDGVKARMEGAEGPLQAVRSAAIRLFEE